MPSVNCRCQLRMTHTFFAALPPHCELHRSSRRSAPALSWTASWQRQRQPPRSRRPFEFKPFEPPQTFDRGRPAGGGGAAAGAGRAGRVTLFFLLGPQGGPGRAPVFGGAPRRALTPVECRPRARDLNCKDATRSPATAGADRACARAPLCICVLTGSRCAPLIHTSHCTHLDSDHF